jgi:WD40 repeat protein
LALADFANEKILISCSNDKTVNFFPLTQDGNQSGPYKSLHRYHTDYVKAINYNSSINILFSAGFDGLIACYDILENKKTSVEYKNENLFYTTTQKESIYCIDSDYSGDFILFGSYENNILCLDRRQRKEILHLRGHNDLVRSLRISPDAKIVKKN